MFHQFADAEKEAIIVRGRALVRLIEAGKVLLAYRISPHERVTFGLAVEAAQAQLRQLVGEVDPSISAQIIAASESALGPIGDVTVN
jgi:hypothetical protein